ncbi:MAG TPA: NAD-dependent epimerase/dehydratase family protein [Pseudonocardiaceae bacterium]|nr:NAD-dependent epimerase/dehydratase family protein [Pseudonocardiaceae bacterium]
MTETVLVTGGSGFLGGWCVYELLRRGYRVRTTVRSADKADGVRVAARSGPDDVDDAMLTVLVAELTRDAGWAEAVDGCDYVLHTASPFPVAQPRNPDELMIPAVEGTRRVLSAALRAGVSRVVLTSSSATVRHLPGAGRQQVFDESTWTDVRDARASTYARSKTLAEQAAWQLVAGDRSKLTTILPGAILGPLRDSHSAYSVQAVSQLLEGTAPGIPRLGFSFVDVRDVADAHLAAMLAPEAGGRRFLVANEFLWLSQVADLLRAELGSAAAKVPTRMLPTLLVRLVALGNPSLRQMRGDLGRRSEFDTTAAQSILDFAPRPIRQTVLDCAHSLLGGLVTQ